MVDPVYRDFLRFDSRSDFLQVFGVFWLPMTTKKPKQCAPWPLALHPMQTQFSLQENATVKLSHRNLVRATTAAEIETYWMDSGCHIVLLLVNESSILKGTSLTFYVSMFHAFPASSTGSGFGWDSIFVPFEHNRPFSQMSMEEKNVLSHRGKAVRKLADWLGRNQEVLLARQEKRGDDVPLGHQGLTFSLRPPQDDKPKNSKQR